MRRLSRWWRRRRAPLTPDYCRQCDVHLRRGQVWEVRTGHALHDGDEMIEVDEAAAFGVGHGGSFLAVTYCRRHAPKGAVRA